MITITRLYSDDQGESHFEDITISIKEAGEIGFLSEGIPVKNIIFREVKPSYDYDFHNAPQRQYLILLDGKIEIETSAKELNQKTPFYSFTIFCTAYFPFTFTESK